MARALGHNKKLAWRLNYASPKLGNLPLATAFHGPWESRANWKMDLFFPCSILSVPRLMVPAVKWPCWNTRSRGVLFGSVWSHHWCHTREVPEKMQALEFGVSLLFHVH